MFKQGDKFHFNLKGSCIELPLILSTIDHKGTEIKMFNTIHSTTAVEIKTSSSFSTKGFIAAYCIGLQLYHTVCMF